MTISQGVFTYLVTWCITLFFVLPFRLRPKRAVLYNTLLAAAVTLALALIIRSGVIVVR